MRPLLALVLLWPVALRAQAVPRADTPARGTVRLTFDPLIETWDERFFDGRRERLGAPLTGDAVGGTYLPLVTRLEEDVRIAAGRPGFVASLGGWLLSARHERRTTPITLEYGVTNRLAISVMLPLVRTFTRVRLALDSASGNVGLNPMIAGPATAAPAYTTFFGQFAGALEQLDQNIASGGYGCPGSAECAAAMDFLAQARAVRDALLRSAYGSGLAGGAPFLPLAGSDGAQGIDSNVTRIQQELSTLYGVGGFSQAFLLPTDTLDADGLDLALRHQGLGFGVDPTAFRNTLQGQRFWAGDVAVSARFRVFAGATYAATLGALVRLPTGHLDSPHDPLDLPAGDGQTDVEAQLVQELIVARRLWLNVSARGGVQRATTRAVRIAPSTAFLAARGATALTDWDPGDYAALDVAPLYRFSKSFAAGMTVGVEARGRDCTSYATPADSLLVAARVGTPLPASLVDPISGVRRTRVGVALTYAGPGVEGGFSVERTVSASGAPLAVATVFRIVLRTSRKLF